jgi:hypothetical protein
VQAGVWLCACHHSFGLWLRGRVQSSLELTGAGGYRSVWIPLQVTVRTDGPPLVHLGVQGAANQVGEALRHLASEFEPPDDSGGAGDAEGGSVARTREWIDQCAEDDMRAMGRVVTLQVRCFSACCPAAVFDTPHSTHRTHVCEPASRCPFLCGKTGGWRMRAQ